MKALLHVISTVLAGLLDEELSRGSSDVIYLRAPAAAA